MSGAVRAATVVKDVYKDSIELMRMSAVVKDRLPGVSLCSVMVATSQNLLLMGDLGFGDVLHKLTASSGDLVVAVQADTQAIANAALELAQSLALETDNSVAEVAEGAIDGSSVSRPPAQSLHEAISVLDISSTKTNATSGADWTKWAIVSVPGEFAVAEALKALYGGYNVFMFSDNVSAEDEAALKQLAVSKGLFHAGPDCGTMLLHGVPFAFANQVRRGRVGLVGASGTGLQEVSCLIERLGSGVSAIIGTGGRDLKDGIDAAMTLQGLRYLAASPDCDAIVVVAKKAPSARVQALLDAAVEQVTATTNKRVVVCFLGASPASSSPLVLRAATLEDAAFLAVQGAVPHADIPIEAAFASRLPPKTSCGYGLYSGGTFAHEAEVLLQAEGADSQWTIIDFGDDAYTVGRPHPMIDLTSRCDFLIDRVGRDLEARVVLLDLVLGHGAHPDPAPSLARTLRALLASPRAQLGPLPIVISVTGAERDPQRIREQIATLRAAYPHLIVAPSNAQAALLAGQIRDGHGRLRLTRDHASTNGRASLSSGETGSAAAAPLRIINVGIAAFADSAQAAGARVASVAWRPPSNGDSVTGRALAHALFDERIDSANAEAVRRIQQSTAKLTGIVVEGAQAVLPNLPSGRWLLHAGPPVRDGWAGLCEPMKGAMIGAMLFEGWAKTPEEAERLGASGAIALSPCNAHSAVGPMAGVISPSMPVVRVRNEASNTTAYSTLNEGLGKVLRFGAYSEEVLTRLQWMRRELAPALHDALQTTGGVDLRAIMSSALAMGDEAHNRNVAATSLFTRQLMVPLARQGERGIAALDFLRGNDHFFLNLSMASCKAALDTAAGIPHSSIVTAMARNGVDIGVRLSGTGDEWFTAPAPVVKGLYFAGYSAADANPDLGDSSITETFGVGALAMAAAPAISLFVGGNAQSAKQATLEMDRITVARHKHLQIPSLDFRGTPLGIDARLVADRSIGPLINTGIAHRKAGVGQVGAGVCRAPVQPFALALRKLLNVLK